MEHLYDVEGMANPAPRIQNDFEKIDSQLYGGETAIAALDIDWSQSKVFTKTLSASSTFTFSNDKDGREIVVVLDASGGVYTATWPGAIEWPAGTAPVLTSMGKDIFYFQKIAGTIYGYARQNFS